MLYYLKCRAICFSIVKSVLVKLSLSSGHIYTVDENDIGLLKIRYNFGAIKLDIFSIAPCKEFTLNLLCFPIDISSLLLFLIALLTVIALPSIAIAIV